jgi:hypothetical protein
MNGDDREVSEQPSVDERVGDAARLDGNAAAGILTLRPRAQRAPIAERSGRSVRCSSTRTAWAPSCAVRAATPWFSASRARGRNCGAT